MAKKDEANRDKFLIESSAQTVKAIDEIRKLSKGLVSSDLKGEFISDAIDRLAKETSNSQQIKISFKTMEIVKTDMTSKLSLNIFRIVQEQLNNIIKHSKATAVNIILLQTRDTLMLSVKDNGIGFDISKKHGGIGINNIISRAKIFKGAANFISEPGKGCTLIVSFPISKAI